MTPSRASVLDALATLFGGAEVSGAWPSPNPILVAAGFRLFGLRLKTFANVDAADKPAMFLVNYGESHARTTLFERDKRTMDFMAVVMLDSSDPSSTPALDMLPLLDAIDDTIASAMSPMTGAVTLGGIVRHVWVEGSARISPGDLDGQSVATYPIRVLCP